MILQSVAGLYLYNELSIAVLDLVVCQYRSVTVSSLCLSYLIY